jgi:hypothetical protein
VFRTSIISLTLALLSLIAVGCKSKGKIEGQLSSSDEAATKPAKARYERVVFKWESTDDGRSGTIRTELPDGEQFSGPFNEIVAGTEVTVYDDFRGSWYGGPWTGRDWTWGGDWPYYSNSADYVAFYTGHVVALLEGDRGTNMRCRFSLDDPSRGIEGGGAGECQTSEGDRITAVFHES